jgi:hypothetical protein
MVRTSPAARGRPVSVVTLGFVTPVKIVTADRLSIWINPRWLRVRAGHSRVGASPMVIRAPGLAGMVKRQGKGVEVGRPD